MQVGATDSAQLRAKGVQAYDIGTVLSLEDLKRIHGNDERIQIAGFGKFVQFLFTATCRSGRSEVERWTLKTAAYGSPELRLALAKLWRWRSIRPEQSWSFLRGVKMS